MNLEKVRGVVVRVVCEKCNGERFVRYSEVQGGLYSCIECAGTGTTNAPMGLDEFRRLLRGDAPGHATDHMRAIMEVVASFYRVPVAGLIGKTRYKEITHARHVAMWLCRRRLDVSFPDIGRAFGLRDHTTVMSAVRKIETMRTELPLSRQGAQIQHVVERLNREKVATPFLEKYKDAGIE